MSGRAGNVEQSGGSGAIPDLIRSAGDDVVRAYREFFDEPVRTASTRKLYGQRARRFFCWAQSRGLTLETIDAAALAAYAGEIASTKSQHEAAIYLTPVRGVLRRLVSSGVLAHDPCPKGQPNGRTNENTLALQAPSIPLSELKRIVLEASEEDGWEEGCEDYQAGLVMLAPLSIDTMDTTAVAAFTGVPEPLVKEFAERLLANGIWLSDGTVALSGDDDLAFMMDVWVATGMLERKVEPAQTVEDAGPAAAGGQKDNPKESSDER